MRGMAVGNPDGADPSTRSRAREQRLGARAESRGATQSTERPALTPQGSRSSCAPRGSPEPRNQASSVCSAAADGQARGAGPRRKPGPRDEQEGSEPSTPRATAPHSIRPLLQPLRRHRAMGTQRSGSTSDPSRHGESGVAGPPTTRRAMGNQRSGSTSDPSRQVLLEFKHSTHWRVARSTRRVVTFRARSSWLGSASPG